MMPGLRRLVRPHVTIGFFTCMSACALSDRRCRLLLVYTLGVFYAGLIYFLQDK
jgi:hypothetical protein